MKMIPRVSGIKIPDPHLVALFGDAKEVWPYWRNSITWGGGGFELLKPHAILSLVYGSDCELLAPAAMSATCCPAVPAIMDANPLQTLAQIHFLFCKLSWS